MSSLEIVDALTKIPISSSKVVLMITVTRTSKNFATSSS
jgi:hypothetical protein